MPYYHEELARIEGKGRKPDYELRWTDFIPVSGFLQYCKRTRDTEDYSDEERARFSKNLGLLVRLNIPFLPFVPLFILSKKKDIR